MRKSIQLLSVLVLVMLMSACTGIPLGSGGQIGQEKPLSAWELFDYSALDYNPGEVLVKTTDFAELEAFAQEHGGAVLQTWPEIRWALVSGVAELEFIEAVRKTASVVVAEPNMMYELPEPPTDTRVLSADELEAEDYDKQWGLDTIQAPTAWDITTGDPNVVVAIVDTGVNTFHPEFADTVWVGPHDVTGEGLEMWDIQGHGTHVAGIAAADGRTGKMAGVVWDSPIMPIKVMDLDGMIWTQYLIDAMLYMGDYAEEHGVRIVANMSIGGRGYSVAFKDAIDYAAERGVLLVTSAGNSYRRIISYPSAYNGVVSVAASTPHDTKADFSSEGWWNAVAAPGVMIWSTYIHGPDYPFGNAFAFLQGTSMASPFVAGAAALLLAEQPHLTPLEIKNQIEQTARGGSFSEALGHGILDTAALLGPLEPMTYGSLDVATNVPDYGLVTVMHANSNTLAAYGTTGADGGHRFWAMRPGSYNVVLSIYDFGTGEFHIQQQQVTVTADATASASFQFELTPLER